jgi:hypothetical protein
MANPAGNPQALLRRPVSELAGYQAVTGYWSQFYTELFGLPDGEALRIPLPPGAKGKPVNDVLPGFYKSVSQHGRKLHVSTEEAKDGWVWCWTTRATGEPSKNGSKPSDPKGQA